MKRIALISQNTESSWLSCQTITRNLKACYELMGSEYELEYFHYSFTSQNIINNAELIDLENEISEYKPDKIIFIDHRPNPYYLLCLLLKRIYYQHCEFYFHIYGDFSLDLAYWQANFKQLKKYKFKLIVASDAQKKLINKFVDITNISVVPFSINANEFKYKGIKKNKSLSLLYTGRISKTKNLVELITYLHKALALKLLPKDFKLTIAGKLDDGGVPFLNEPRNEGEMYYLIFKKLKRKLGDEFFDKHLDFIGFQGKKVLQKLYQTHHLYMNLSTYNDEDYGMSIAEALASGQPCLLSHWGGFKSFENRFKQVLTTKVRLKSNVHTISEKQFLSILPKLIKMTNYQKMSNIALDQLSIAVISKVLKKEIACIEVEKFTQIKKKLKNGTINFYSKKEKDCYQYNTLYLETYEAYN
jgi:glycosyltransferase involved in cell wall biosynthesis